MLGLRHCVAQLFRGCHLKHDTAIPKPASPSMLDGTLRKIFDEGITALGKVSSDLEEKQRF
jgi:hypothetical protein